MQVALTYTTTADPVLLLLLHSSSLAAAEAGVIIPQDHWAQISSLCHPAQGWILPMLAHQVLLPVPIPPAGVGKQLVVAVHSTPPPVSDHAEPVLCIRADLSARTSHPDAEEIRLGCDSFVMEYPSFSSEEKALEM